MPDFHSNRVRIHYETFGEGRPIVLVHGFGVSLGVNWVATGWIDVLSPLRQVIALDCRGHGESDKPHEPSAYAAHEMTDDVVRLMDHLGVATADLMGYSMGAGIALRAIVRHPERFTSAVLGGIGEVQRRGGSRPGVAEALLAPVERAQLEAIRVPVLIANGARDALAGSAREMALAIPGARLVELPDKDHLTAVADKQFKELVLAFLKEPAAVR